MAPNDKTPSQHNSTLFISPLINRRPNLFVTPPNPAGGLFDSPQVQGRVKGQGQAQGQTSRQSHSASLDSFTQNQGVNSGYNGMNMEGREVIEPSLSQILQNGQGHSQGLPQGGPSSGAHPSGAHPSGAYPQGMNSGIHSGAHSGIHLGVHSGIHPLATNSEALPSGGISSVHAGHGNAISPAEKLRLWRHDALNQHHYATAEYIGDKVLTLTNDPNDAFWLAQVHFATGNYLRAKQLLTPFTAQSISCRYLTAYSLIKLELWDDALDVVGEHNPFTRDDNYQVSTTDGGIKLESTMCYLRGLIYANQNNFERAKESYKEALFVDVKCFEAFRELVRNNLMTPSEEWEFVSSLNFRNADDDNAELVKLLYTTHLSKYCNAQKFQEVEEILADEYQLGDNSDILLSKADYLYVQCQFDECLAVCERVLARDTYNFNAIPIYLSCLYELGAKNKLFLKAHELAENHAQNPTTWLAIGIYYLSIGKVIESRKFFSKTTLLNPNFGQAWIGFAHTFAAEGEHEQAISAYAFAARLFPGTHLANLFLGMQHLQMNNLNLAEEYLMASYQICSTDPLLLNELGVINYHRGKFGAAESYCQEALGAAKHLNSDSKTWISIHTNLGHILRKSGDPHKALECFQQVLRISSRDDSNVMAAMGLIYLKLNDHESAIEVLHEALAITPSDPVSSDLLKRALEQNAEQGARFLGAKSTRLMELNLPTMKERRRRHEHHGMGMGEHLADITTSSNKFSGAGGGTTPVKKNMVVVGRKRVVSGAAGGASGGGGSGGGDRGMIGIDEHVGTDATIAANALKRGEESSDEDDEVMDIESE
ncbi:anaphase-promoting complex subunit Cdc16p [[Candida] anglica]|uniref:Anaphase-promoting complex subunit Cdc16p n=1 Tax=[Candida] anglica TaxID=148631 RepID=A0ABP0EGM8_9ASCO